MNNGMHGESRDQLRQRMRLQRAVLSKEEQLTAAEAAAQRILALDAYKAADTVMAYIAVRGELSLAPVLEAVLASGRRLALPRCEGPGVMTARWIERLEQLEPGAYGLLEPSRDCEIIAPQEIGLILVPGTVFDRMGGRIGQGGGYYDRFLPETKGTRAGICHDFALVERVDMQAHDVRMDLVVTPDALYIKNNDRT